jgi:hypothetical protein
MKVLEQPAGKDATLWTAKTERRAAFGGTSNQSSIGPRPAAFATGENPARRRGHLDKLASAVVIQS